MCWWDVKLYSINQSVRHERLTIVDVTDAGEHTEQFSPVNVTEFICNTLSLRAHHSFFHIDKSLSRKFADCKDLHRYFGIFGVI